MSDAAVGSEDWYAEFASRSVPNLGLGQAFARGRYSIFALCRTRVVVAEKLRAAMVSEGWPVRELDDIIAENRAIVREIADHHDSPISWHHIGNDQDGLPLRELRFYDPVADSVGRRVWRHAPAKDKRTLLGGPIVVSLFYRMNALLFEKYDFVATPHNMDGRPVTPAWAVALGLEAPPEWQTRLDYRPEEFIPEDYYAQ